MLTQNKKEKYMNKLLVLLAGVLFSTSSLAMTSSYGIGTDYMWRGQSQSDHGMAANFGIEQDLGGGFYGGVWGSTVDINGDRELESDYYGGFKKQYGEFWVNAEYIAYRYTGDNANEFEERIFAVGYNAFSYGKAVGIDGSQDYEWYDISLPFISWADVTFHMGEWEDGVEDKSLTVDWSLTDSLIVGLHIMDTVKEDEVKFGNAVSLHIKVNL
jgi:uncharacterized protein (TIGR02001 family)|tara:strand:+ start:4597 stop:5238 length:642 start_codon:yes stop_codon:yes gene_type:complete